MKDENAAGREEDKVRDQKSVGSKQKAEDESTDYTEQEAVAA